MRRLLRSLPSYMILHDDEIEDNRHQDRIYLAISADMSDQWSHSPRNFGRRLFHTFECGSMPR